jgi:hypothetical protein
MSTFLVAQPARTDMAYSNAVYVNAADLNKFPPSENQQVYTQLPDGIVWKVHFVLHHFAALLDLVSLLM